MDNILNFNHYSVAILAGGKGTRIQNLFPNIPKPLIEISNKPVLFHQIDFFIKNNINNIFILAGYKGDLIAREVNKNYSNVEVIIEENPLDTCGCLSLLKDKIKTKHLMIVSGDLLFDIDLNKFCNFYTKSFCDCVLTVHSNYHPMDADLIDYDESNNEVKKIIVRPHNLNENYLNNVNAAITIINTNLLKLIKDNTPQNFEKNFLNTLIINNYKICAYKSIEYIRDMGTPERLFKIQEDYAKNLPEKLKFSSNKKSILFNLKEISEIISKNMKEKMILIVNDIKKLNQTDSILIGFNYSNINERKKIESFFSENNVKLDLIISQSFEKDIIEKINIFDSNIIHFTYYKIEK